MIKKAKLYNDIKQLSLYKNSKNIGVVVPNRPNKKIDKFYQKMVEDGKKLCFLSFDDLNRPTFRTAPISGFNVVKNEKGVPYCDKQYGETDIPDFILVEFNSKKTTNYAFLNGKFDVPIIGFVNKFVDENATTMIPNMMIGNK